MDKKKLPEYDTNIYREKLIGQLCAKLRHDPGAFSTVGVKALSMLAGKSELLHICDRSVHLESCLSKFRSLLCVL